MRQLSWRTTRFRRGLLDRLRGFDRLYETKVTDGEHVAFGRGRTREDSQESAQRNWNAKFAVEGIGFDELTRENRPGVSMAFQVLELMRTMTSSNVRLCLTLIRLATKP
jgi:hypothetical protein